MSPSHPFTPQKTEELEFRSITWIRNLEVGVAKIFAPSPPSFLRSTLKPNHQTHKTRVSWWKVQRADPLETDALRRQRNQSLEGGSLKHLEDKTRDTLNPKP